MGSNRFYNLLIILFLALTRNAIAATPETPGAPQLITAPFGALNKVAGIVAPKNPSIISPREFAMLSDVANGRASRWTAAEVALLASGIRDEDELRDYLARFQEITAQAADVTADAQNPQEKAAALGQFLRKSPLHGGFISGQVDIRKLLDDGTYNCVSSAILFNIVGQPLGLNTRRVQIPNHVFLRMGNVFIEPTSGKTYSADDHERIVDKQWNQASAFTKAAYGRLRSYESGNIGLIGEIYFDQAVDYAETNRQPGEAVVCGLKAICLDPQNPVFLASVEKNLKKWFASDVEQNRLDRARTLAQTSAQLFGNRPGTSQMYRTLASATTQRTLRQVAAR